MIYTEEEKREIYKTFRKVPLEQLREMNLFLELSNEEKENGK